MRYRSIAGGRAFFAVVMAMFAVVMVALLFAAGPGGVSIRPWFLVAWTAMFVVTMPWSLWIVSCELRIVGDSITAEYVLRRSSIAIDRITAIRSLKWAADVAVIEVEGERPVFVWASRKGFRAFTEEITRRKPGVYVRLGWHTRMADRMPGHSGFRR